jgi:hypothetical protein
VEALAKTPDRWSPTEYAHFEGEPREPSPVLVEEAFAVVEEGLSELGPVAADEPLREHFGDQAVREWLRFFTRFPSRPSIDPVSAREYVERLPGSPSCKGDRQQVTWPGMMRAWLRAQFGMLAQSIIMDVPPHYYPDPQDLRKVSFRCLERVALLLPDPDQAGCLNLMADREQQGVKELARRLYHHPEAGPHVKAMIDKMFVKRFAAKLKANPPESHDPIPWRT